MRGGANDRRVLVFAATYNEHDNVETFTRAVLSQSPDYDLLIVDDASPDGTGTLLDQMCRTEPRLRVIHRAGKLGLGTAHKLAMVQAIAEAVPILVTLDADMSHDPTDIPRLVAALDGADFAIGSRHMPGGAILLKFHRRLLSIGANRLARLLLGVPLTEFTTSLRAFRVPMLARLDLRRLEAEGYAFFVETVFLVARSGASLAEIPIRFQDRREGQSKISRLEILRGIATLFRLFGRRLVDRVRSQT
ncbi:MAG: polyprenol monophosphomannose synthase [Rhodospirillales bacterium]|nr:polyprenol monophosphomannose synthase [Rhodospirillales bacterium]